MSLKEQLVKVREYLHRALIGHANRELDQSLRRESAERLRRIDEKLRKAEETCEIDLSNCTSRQPTNGPETVPPER